MALAGGAQIASNPFEFSALGKSGFLAPSGGCKTFRADADGYCRGEAVGVLVLKRLEDALADNDKIDALITGWGRNYSAGASSMTHPHPESQARLIRQVLRQANVKPGDIGYAELHGTGTIVRITCVFIRGIADQNTYLGWRHGRDVFDHESLRRSL
jgi:acyl transferase domain-containing protein